MRVPINELMEKLGVGHVLSAYETYPWTLYDAAKRITCSAEVRVGPGSGDIEAEIQFVYDEPEEGETEDTSETESTDTQTGSGTGDSGDTSPPKPKRPPSGVEQIMHMRILPTQDQKWHPTLLRVKGEDYVNKIYDWEGKGCEFFRACVQAIQMNELPDIEKLIDEELDDTRRGGGKRGRIGKKSPSIKPGQLLGMKP